MTQRIDLPRTVVFALCGSFCTFGAVLPQIQALVGRGWQVLPALSWAAARQDTRFGTAESWRRQLTARKSRVQTIFTLGSSLCIRLSAG